MSRENKQSRQIAIVGVPSSAGARVVGQEEAPGALREAGFAAFLREAGLDVIDRGDLPKAVFHADSEHPKSQNGHLVCRVARDVARELETVGRTGAFPVVLGGDCTITIGVLSGLLRDNSRLGLLYCDGDLDLNTPDTTTSGVFDGMVSAHLLGHGFSNLARIGPRHPLLPESHLAYFGYNERAGGIDPAELTALESSAALRFSAEAVRDDPLGSARNALDALESRAQSILVHFDLDVTDASAVDVAHTSGIPLDMAASILEVFLASPKCVGLVVTEYNPNLDKEAAVATRLAQHIAKALGVALTQQVGV